MIMCVRVPADIPSIEAELIPYNCLMESMNVGFFFNGFSNLEVNL